MGYNEIVVRMILEEGVDESTMMKTPCLRYKDQFIAMMVEKENALIIKVSPERVAELISERKGKPFNFTKKRFKEWVLIPLEYEKEYEGLLYESLAYVKTKKIFQRRRRLGKVRYSNSLSNESHGAKNS